jgi:ribonuclease P protein component
MFEKEKRFSFKQGLPKKVINTPYFSLRFDHKKSDTGTIAVVVSKKVSKKAVIRNRIKRKFLSVLKETLREKQEFYDIVIYVRPYPMDLDERILEKLIKESLEKI